MPSDLVPFVETIDLSQWKPDEHHLLDHFVDFARAANCVVTEPGPMQGWFSEALNRTDVYLPFNGRIMENHYTLAFFLGHDAPWNVYHRHPEVLRRLGFALDYTFGLMGPDGAIPEYAPVEQDTPMLAPSSFGAEYLALSLEVAGPVLPPDLKERLTAHARKAAVFALTSEGCFEHAQSFTNQILGALVAAAKLARLTGDGELLRLVEHRGEALLGSFMAPMGFLYEADGPETFAYFYTTLGRLIPLFHEWPDGRILEVLRRHGAWMSRWMLLEPDHKTLVASTSHETRTRSGYRIVPRAFPGIGPLLRPANVDEKDERQFIELLLMPEETAQARQGERQNTKNDLVRASRARREHQGYGNVSSLAGYASWAPTEAECASARDALPYLHNRSSAENHADDRGNQYLFVRHERYYAGFAFATHGTMAHHGPAFVWLDNFGTLILSENGGRGGWETMVGDEGTGRTHALARLRAARGGHEVALDYGKLGVNKTYVLRPDRIDVFLTTSGVGGRALRERIPLLLRDGDVIHCDYGRCQATRAAFGAVSRRITIERAQTPLLRFDFGAPVLVTFRPTVDPDGFVRTEMTFPYSATAVRRAGYAITIGGA